MRSLFTALLLLPYILFSQKKGTDIVVRLDGSSVSVRPSGSTVTVNPTIDTTLVVNNLRADLERLTNITVSGNTVTANRPFTQQDVGKVLVIKQARSYPQYVGTPITLNATVTGVTGGTATFTSFDANGSVTNATNTTGFIGTDNWQTLNTAITDCQEYGKRRLLLNYTGTVYLVPQLHTNALFGTRRYGQYVGIDLTISGLSKSTVLKYGMEDIMQVNHSTEPDFSAFVQGNCTLRVNNLTIESPDRISTENDVQNCIAFNSIPVATTDTSRQNLVCTNVDILNGEGKFWQGFGSAYFNNSSYVTGQMVMSFTNSTQQVQAGAAFFNAQTGNSKKDSAFRVLRVINSDISAGAKYAWESLGNVKVTQGSDTVEVTNSPSWSWYDRNYYLDIGSNTRTIQFTLVNTPVPNTNPYTGPTLQGSNPGSSVLDSTSAIYCKVVEIISPTKVRIATSGVSGGLPNYNLQVVRFTSNTCNLYTNEPAGQFRWAAFHTNYVSGNVGTTLTNSQFHALRFVLNRQNPYTPIYENSTTNTTCVKDISFPPAEKLRNLVQGPGFSAGTGTSQECGTF